MHEIPNRDERQTDGSVTEDIKERKEEGDR